MYRCVRARPPCEGVRSRGKEKEIESNRTERLCPTRRGDERMSEREKEKERAGARRIRGRVEKEIERDEERWETEVCEKRRDREREWRKDGKSEG